MDDALTALPTRELIARLATREPIPGGGSASALAGATAAALVEMVVALTAGRPDAASAEAVLGEVGERAGALRTELLDLTERDADAYDAVIRARRLPRSTPEEISARAAATADATRLATEVPLLTARAAAAVLALAERLVPVGNPNAISDVGVAALLAGAAIRGAGLNVRINLPYLADDDPLRADAEAELGRLLDEADRAEPAVQAAVAERMA